MKIRNLLAASASALMLGLAATPAIAQAPKPPTIQNGVDGVIEAFKSRPLVGMSEFHGLGQLIDFYGAIVRDPRFARDVGNVVIEGGTILHQGIVDRYINGEDVPYSELRKVWLDSVSQPVPTTSIGASLFQRIRIVNMTLPPEQRIKVWVAEPPSDWTKIATRADFGAILAQRDRHGADTIVASILKKNKKALVIYGGAHFQPSPDLSRKTPAAGAEAMVKLFVAGNYPFDAMTPDMANVVRSSQGSPFANRGAMQSLTFVGGDEEGRDSFDVKFADGVVRAMLAFDEAGKLKGLTARPAGPDARVNIRTGVEQSYPNAWFVVTPYMGFETKACTDAFEKSVSGWKAPSLIGPVKGSTLEVEGKRLGCRSYGGWTDGRNADAVIYLGPVESLTQAAAFPDPYFTGDYLKEYNRRQQIKGQAPVVPGVTPGSAVPAKFRSFDTPVAPASQAQREAAFAANDANKDGKLDKLEYAAVLKVLGYADQLDSLFLQRDVNRDYFVSADEYKTPIPQ